MFVYCSNISTTTIALQYYTCFIQRIQWKQSVLFICGNCTSNNDITIHIQLRARSCQVTSTDGHIAWGVDKHMGRVIRADAQIRTTLRTEIHCINIVPLICISTAKKRGRCHRVNISVHIPCSVKTLPPDSTGVGEFGSRGNIGVKKGKLSPSLPTSICVIWAVV